MKALCINKVCHDHMIRVYRVGLTPTQRQQQQDMPVTTVMLMCINMTIRQLHYRKEAAL
jgi:hypothetical protein